MAGSNKCQEEKVRIGERVRELGADYFRQGIQQGRPV